MHIHDSTEICRSGHAKDAAVGLTKTKNICPLQRMSPLPQERGCSCPGLANRHATGVTSRNILRDKDWSRISTHIVFTALGRACRKKLHKGEKSQGNPESKSMLNSRCRHIFSPNTMMTLQILQNILSSLDAKFSRTVLHRNLSLLQLELHNTAVCNDDVLLISPEQNHHGTIRKVRNAFSSQFIQHP